MCLYIFYFILSRHVASNIVLVARIAIIAISIFKTPDTFENLYKSYSHSRSCQKTDRCCYTAGLAFCILYQSHFLTFILFMLRIIFVADFQGTLLLILSLWQESTSRPLVSSKLQIPSKMFDNPCGEAKMLCTIEIVFCVYQLYC